MDRKAREALLYIQKEKIAKISTGANDNKQEELISQMRQYEIYRDNYAANIVFDPTNSNLSKFCFIRLAFELVIVLFQIPLWMAHYKWCRSILTHQPTMR